MQNIPCDQIPNGFGEFGRTLTNPVPVNGPVGELVYLSRLETTEGIPIAFHRLGSSENVDVFETVSENGQHWDLLYFSMYFPRKSRAVPAGYRMMADRARRSLIRGTTLQLDEFPKGIFRATIECTERKFGIPIADSRVKSLEARMDVARTREHMEALHQLRLSGQTLRGRDSGDHRHSTPRFESLLDFFSETFELVKAHIEQSAREMEIPLSSRFDRELTFVLLYVFTTLLFMNPSRQDPTSSADRLAKWNLARLSRLEGAQIGDVAKEYRTRFDHFRQIKLFMTSDHILVNDGALSLGRQLAGSADMVFGAIVTGLISAALAPIREGLASVEA